MGKEKRKRGQDFSDLEVLTLVEFVSHHKQFLFGTGGKGSSKEEKVKERNWKKASVALRTVGGPEREWPTVRKKWRDLASKAKAYKAPKTGGGPPKPENPLYEKVLLVLAKEVVSGILSENDEASSQETVISAPDEELEPEPEQAQTGPTHHSMPPMPAGNHSTKLSSRPAAVRQCEIQEELLQIQRAKLDVKKEQTIVLRSILDALREICGDKSAVNMLNSMQGI